jgi:hypothetical protein
MILRLCLNETDLQCSKQLLTLVQRQPDRLRRIFSRGRATADLMNANDPIRSDQLQMTRHFIPNSRLQQRPGAHSTPHVLDGLMCTRRPVG